MNRQSRAAAGLTLAAAFFLAGCATSRPPGPAPLDTEGLDLSAYSAVTAKLDFEAGTVVLPADSINHAGPAFEEAHRAALRAVVGTCLAGLGAPPREWSTSFQPLDNRLYGLWSVSLASRFGFGFAGDDQPEPVPLTTDETHCYSEADELIGPVLKGMDTPDIDVQITRTAYDSVMASREGKAAIAKASACQVEQGLTVDSTTGFPRSDPSDSDSEANIRIAVIEATCNVETGAIQALFDLTARYQAALMDRNEAAVTALQQKNADRIEKLKAIESAAR